jgi:hypothetical protein
MGGKGGGVFDDAAAQFIDFPTPPHTPTGKSHLVKRVNRGTSDGGVCVRGGGSIHSAME